VSETHSSGPQRRILVVEDDYVIAAELAESLTEFGASVVGPAASVAEALALIVREVPLDAAVLDVNLGSENVFPVADALEQRGVPYVFATGYDQRIIPARYAAARRFEKPVDVQALARFLFR
jgi:CheY-like chemotaxis protein